MSGHKNFTLSRSRSVKISCIRKMARDWKTSSQEALRDYKSRERQHLITEDAIHRGSEGTPRPLWETPPSSEGPRGCNHQQHDHDWRTTSRRETASWEESCWWVSLRGESLRCICQIESDIANMCAVIAWIWIVNVYCHDRFPGHMACSYAQIFSPFPTVAVCYRLT